MSPNFRRLSRAIAMTLFLLPVSAAHAQITTFYAWLNGQSENPAQNTPATGQATVTLNQTLNTMRVQVTFFGLVAPNTAAHIHCCVAVPNGTAGVATTTPTFTGFPTGVNTGSYDNLFDMTLATSYNPAFVNGQGGIPQAFTTLSNGLFAGTAYLNIHSTFAPGGEIRGFLQVVPEPSTYALMASGLLALGIVARKRRRV